MFQHLTFPSLDLPLNFLHAFGFICRLTPIGLSTTSYVYAHAASISKFPLHQQSSTTSCMQLVARSKFPHPVPGPKTMYRSQKKAPRSKNIQSNVSAYNNGVPPHPCGSKVRKAGARVQKQNRCQKQIPSLLGCNLSGEMARSSHNHATPRRSILSDIIFM